MDKLTKELRKAGYDLIEGPVRNHKLLQLWVKKTFDEVDLYYSNMNQAFVSDFALTEVENPALNINSSKKDEFSFNIGITLLDEILKSLGLGAFELSAQITGGKSITISYDNSVTKEIPIGEIESYLSTADFKHPNPSLLQNANRNNIIVITGVVLAKNLVVDIETNFNVDAELVASLNNAADGKLDFAIGSTTKIKMVSSGNSFFPIAVKAHRLDFDRSKFSKLVLVTDSRNLF
jgi:hypothetical protein